jgi:hypothetical protein
MEDSYYELPTRKWFESTFPKALLKFWRKNKLVKYDYRLRRYRWKYAAETNDCGNASMGAVWFGAVHNWKANGKYQKAVGEFWYIDRKIGAHAIVVALTNSRKISFMEPQTCKPVKLTPAEIESCYFYRF